MGSKTTRTAGLSKDGTATFAAFARRGDGVDLWWAVKRPGEPTQDMETIATFPGTAAGMKAAERRCREINMAATGRENARSI